MSEVTRGNNILDIVCTDEPIVSDAHAGLAFGNSDHNTVLFTIDAPSVESHRTTDEKVYLWSQADYTAISEYSWLRFGGLNYLQLTSPRTTSGMRSASY